MTGWRVVEADDVEDWDERLAAAGAPLFQRPCWNRFLRRRGLRPVYVVADDGGAFVTVLQSGAWPMRVGLVQRGPVVLRDGVATAEIMASLVAWARRRGFVFLRFTSSDPAVVDGARSLPGALDADLFPVFNDDDHDLHVHQLETDEDTFSSLAKTCRKHIRRAERAGYTVRRGSLAELEIVAFPMFSSLAGRKGFRVRPLPAFRALFSALDRRGEVALYLAEREGVASDAVLVARDGSTIRYIWGALDEGAVAADAPSPAALVHWVAMRDAHRNGAAVYNLGVGSPASVATFKSRFHPERVDVTAVTVPVGRLRLRLWRRVGLPLLAKLRR